MSDAKQMKRRTFLRATAALPALWGLGGLANAKVNGITVAGFIKHLQSLSYDDLTSRMAKIGYDSLEVTVRRNGYILPENAADELPKLADIAKKNGIGLGLLTTDITSVETEYAEPILRTAEALGIQKYRTGYLRYDLDRPVADQLTEWRPQWQALAALNSEIGVQGLYQNHAGDRQLGAPIWDLLRLFEGIDPAALGIVFDIRHATVEGGQSWPIQFNAVQPYLGAVYVKDFVWEGRKVANVPLGEGMVDPRFFDILKRMNYQGLLSIHVEYLGDAQPEVVLNAYKKDMDTFRKLMA